MLCLSEYGVWRKPFRAASDAVYEFWFFKKSWGREDGSVGKMLDIETGEPEIVSPASTKSLMWWYTSKIQATRQRVVLSRLTSALQVQPETLHRKQWGRKATEKDIPCQPLVSTHMWTLMHRRLPKLMYTHTHTWLVSLIENFCSF